MRRRSGPAGCVRTTANNKLLSPERRLRGRRLAAPATVVIMGGGGGNCDSPSGTPRRDWTTLFPPFPPLADTNAAAKWRSLVRETPSNRVGARARRPRVVIGPPPSGSGLKPRFSLSLCFTARFNVNINVRNVALPARTCSKASLKREGGRFLGLNGNAVLCVARTYGQARMRLRNRKHARTSP